MIDIHIHTKHCPHASGEIVDYVRTAFNVERLEIIGFSEHFYLPEGFKDPAPKGNESAMFPESLELYINDVLVAKSKNPNVLLGTELDWISGYEQAIRGNLSQVKDRLDYVIGAIHFINGWCFDYDEKVFEKGLDEHFNGNIEKCIDSYFNLEQQLIEEDIIDVVAHIDLIKKFNKNGKYFSEDNLIYRRRVEETLQLVKEKDLLLEINTAGIDKTVGEIYPSKRILERCHELEIRLTLGSDAHKLEQVGRYFDRAIAQLKDIGYTKLHYVQKRMVKKVDI